MNDRREAAGRANAPETGRRSVNNGLEVKRGTRGVAHAPAARAGRGAAGAGAGGHCASRQLLRGQDRANASASIARAARLATLAS